MKIETGEIVECESFIPFQVYFQRDAYLEVCLRQYWQRMELFFESLIIFLIFSSLCIWQRFEQSLQQIVEALQMKHIIESSSERIIIYWVYGHYHSKAKDKCLPIQQYVMTCHNNYQHLQYQSMKQQISGELLTPSQSNEQNRKQRIQKKRKIRKEKVQKSSIDFTDLRSIDTSKLSREEKAKVQKAKNREAAQKSRDTHKDYVSNLQKQVKELSELLLKSRKFCWRCQKDLQDSNLADSYSICHLSSQQKSSSGHKCTAELNEAQQVINEYSIFNNNSVFDEQSSFLRAQPNQQSYPYMKTMFFVAMIVAIICVSSFSTEKFQSRALMEISQPQNDLKSVKQIEIKIPNLANSTVQDKNKTAVVKIENQNYGLIALNNDDCIKSLIKGTQPTPYHKKSLTSYNENPTRTNSLAYSQGVLLCSMPKANSFKQKINEMRSPLVRLYLLGSQIKQLISNFGLMVPVMDKNIQINGIYQVLAKIKEVNIVNNHNCLL